MARGHRLFGPPVRKGPWIRASPSRAWSCSRAVRTSREPSPRSSAPPAPTPSSSPEGTRLSSTRRPDEAREYGATATDTVLFDAEEPELAAAVVAEAFEKSRRFGGVSSWWRWAPWATRSTMRTTPWRSARMITVNETWPVAAFAEVRRRLVAQGHGRILVLSSSAAVRVRRVSYLYSGAKAGLDRLCVGLAESLEGTGVRLQLLRPAAVRTRMSLGLAPTPFTTGANEVADNALRGLNTEPTRDLEPADPSLRVRPRATHATRTLAAPRQSLADAGGQRARREAARGQAHRRDANRGHGSSRAPTVERRGPTSSRSRA